VPPVTDDDAPHAITVHLDEILADRGMTMTALAERVGITLANLSILKTGKAKAIRFGTLSAICAELGESDREPPARHTHVALWALTGGPGRLGPHTLDLLRDPRNVVAVSAASVWEVEIKRTLGKLDAPAGFARECADRGFDEFPITFDHADAAARLPLLHTDLFDRMLIGQAVVEEYRVAAADRAFARYDVEVVDPSG
jgi:PIN domain nuclease of toxin-antitoxin system/DNA-binding Xre family transcriptional regulator